MVAMESRNEPKLMPAFSGLVWISDLDGVWTNPSTHRVNTEVVKKFAGKLQEGDVLVLATGRPFKWLKEHILPALKKEIKNETLLERLLVNAENGAVLASSKDDFAKEQVLEQYAVPGAVVGRAAAYAENDEKNNNIYIWDPLKSAMVSFMTTTEKQGASENVKDIFHKMKPKIIKVLNKLLDREVPAALRGDYVVQATAIAVDIFHKEAGKALAARNALAWLDEKGLKASSFIAIGDSPVDAELYTELSAKRPEAKLEFVYLGDQEIFEEVVGISGEQIKIYSNSNDTGVLSYFSTFQAEDFRNSNKA